MGAGAAEFLHADVFAGDGLDDVGSGDEHVGGLVDHDHEVGDRGGVDGAAGAGAHDEADLRDDAGGVGVAAEDLAVHAERGDAFLDARAAGVVDADDGAAGFQGEVHHLDDLLAVDLAERAAEDGEVLGEDRDGAAFDGAVTGDDTVAVGAVGGQAEVGRAVPGELVQFGERSFVQEEFDPLTGGQLALFMLLVDRAAGAGVRRFLDAVAQIGELPRGRVDVVLRLGHGGGSPALGGSNGDAPRGLMTGG